MKIMLIITSVALNQICMVIWSYKTYKCVHSENPETFATTSKGTKPNQKIHNKDH